MKKRLVSSTFSSMVACLRQTLATGVIAVLAILMPWQSAVALPVEGLYQEEISVANQGEQERRRAYREAFASVITKVTGETRWLEHSQIAPVLNNADRYVAEVIYRSATQAGQNGQLEVRFDQTLIDDLLDRANIPVWDNNRASVLLWITVQEADGRRVMLGSSSEHPLLDQARAFADVRAVPVLVPLLDLEDRRLVTPDQAWSLDAMALQQVAARYDADSILAGRVLVTPSGELVGFWQQIFRNDVQTFDHISPVASYMALPLDTITSRLANHFGLVRSEFDQENQVNIRVDGIRNLPSHVQLIQYLESLSVVQHVQLVALRPDSLELHLRVLGSAQVLSEFITLGRDLEPVNFAPGQPVSDLLHYRWTR